MIIREIDSLILSRILSDNMIVQTCSDLNKIIDNLNFDCFNILSLAVLCALKFNFDPTLMHYMKGYYDSPVK